MPVCCSVATRGCLPPWANICVVAPTYQISSAVRIFFRISDMGVWTNPWGSPPSPLLLPCHTPISHFSIPLQVGPLNSVRKSGDRCKLPQRYLERSPGRNWIWISHFTLGNPKRHFSTVLFIHTSYYLRYLRRKQTVTPLPTTPEKCHRTTL